MNGDKRNEICDLLRKGSLNAVLVEEGSKDGNVIPGRFVLAINSNLIGKTKHRARFVVHDHCDKLKEIMVQSSETL